MPDPSFNQILSEINTHIAVLNDDLTRYSIAYATDLAMLKERVDWLYKFFWIVMTASVGAFLTNIYQIISNRKK